MPPVNQHQYKTGQSLSEYALILALIAAVCVGALTQLGTNTAQSLQTLRNTIETTATVGVGDDDPDTPPPSVF